MPKRLNPNDDLAVLVRERMIRQDAWRKKVGQEKAEAKRARNAATRQFSYSVQYAPCGHFRIIQDDEKDLLEKAEKYAEKHLDAYILPSEECSECESYRENNLEDFLMWDFPAPDDSPCNFVSEDDYQSSPEDSE